MTAKKGICRCHVFLFDDRPPCFLVIRHSSLTRSLPLLTGYPRRSDHLPAGLPARRVRHSSLIRSAPGSLSATLAALPSIHWLPSSAYSSFAPSSARPKPSRPLHVSAVRFAEELAHHLFFACYSKQIESRERHKPAPTGQPVSEQESLRDREQKNRRIHRVADPPVNSVYDQFMI